MQFQETPLAGVMVISLDRHTDHRGFFARTFCEDELNAAGIYEDFTQQSVSFNLKENTLRGMHYQADSHPEGKLVRCTSGAIYDVVIDVRPQSKSFKQWFGIELTASNHTSLYIPPGCAHGFLTQAPNTEVLYCMHGKFHALAARGVRWNDPAFGVSWPGMPAVIADRDANYPNFEG